MKKALIVTMSLCLAFGAYAQKEIKLASPNGRVTTKIELGQDNKVGKLFLSKDLKMLLNLNMSTTMLL